MWAVKSVETARAPFWVRPEHYWNPGRALCSRFWSAVQNGDSETSRPFVVVSARQQEQMPCITNRGALRKAHPCGPLAFSRMRFVSGKRRWEHRENGVGQKKICTRTGSAGRRSALRWSPGGPPFPLRGRLRGSVSQFRQWQPKGRKVSLLPNLHRPHRGKFNSDRQPLRPSRTRNLEDNRRDSGKSSTGSSASSLHRS
jgi:hypothetical protein